MAVRFVNERVTLTTLFCIHCKEKCSRNDKVTLIVGRVRFSMLIYFHSVPVVNNWAHSVEVFVDSALTQRHDVEPALNQ